MIVRVGSVVQCNERTDIWCGCLMIVTEVKPWGVMAGMAIPGRGTAYLRMTDDQYEYIGEAVFVKDNPDPDPDPDRSINRED